MSKSAQGDAVLSPKPDKYVSLQFGNVAITTKASRSGQSFYVASLRFHRQLDYPIEQLLHLPVSARMATRDAWDGPEKYAMPRSAYSYALSHCPLRAPVTFAIS